MTFIEARYALQLEAEERVGAEMRRQVAEVNAAQDAASAALRGVFGGGREPR